MEHIYLLISQGTDHWMVYLLLQAGLGRGFQAAVPSAAAPILLALAAGVNFLSLSRSVTFLASLGVWSFVEIKSLRCLILVCCSLGPAYSILSILRVFFTLQCE